jgi:TP901 family phage tail tape measure protein
VAVAVVDIRVDSTTAVNNLRRIDQASRRSQDALDALTRSAAGLAAAFAGGFAIDRVIRDATELDRNLRRLGTVGGDVKALDKELGTLSKNLGGVANKAELAAASYQALSAGFTETADNIKIVEAATKAAVGGLADTTQVTEVLTKTLNAYGLSGEYATNVTDSISKAIEYGQVTWSDYTSQLGRVASTAALAGLSIDEVNAFVAAATKNGATAEVAFTGLSAALATILKPTKESTDAAAALGIQWNIAGLQTKGFGGLLNELSKKQDTNKEAAAALIGSQEALRGVFAANSKQGADYRMILEGLGNAAGKTDSDFETMRGSLENTLKALDTSFANLSEALAKAFGPTVVLTINDLTKSINGFADVINTVPQPVLNATGEIIKLAIQMALLKKALDAIIALRVAYLGAIGGMAAATATAGTAAATSASAFALYTNNTKALEAAATTATPKLAGLRTVLGNLAAIGSIAIAINIAIYGLEELRRTQAELDRLRGKKPGGIPASGVFPGETRQGLQQRQAAQRKQIPILQQKIREQEAVVAGMPAGMGVFARRELDILRGRLTEAQRTVAADASALPDSTRRGLPKPQQQPQAPGAETDEQRKAREKREKEAERAARIIEESRRALSVSNQQVAIEERLFDARKGGNDQLVLARQTQQDLLNINARIADIRANKDLPAEAKLLQIKELENDAKRRAAQFDYDIFNLKEEQRKKDQELIKAGQDKLQNLMDEEALLRAKLAGNEAEVILQQQLRDLMKDTKGLSEADVKAKLQGIEALKKQIAAADQMKQLYTDIGSTIKDGVVDAIQGAIDGTKSLGDVASQVLRSISAKLIDVGVNLALFGSMTGSGTGGGLLGMVGLGGKRAMGGSVSSGRSYLVGERGPELFTPGRSGGIAPSGTFGATNVVVNVDASGSSVQGDAGSGAALGRVIAAAVQSELVKQKRPGGILA